jgi:putative PIN family toxin of toxin-antitoxin system
MPSVVLDASSLVGALLKPDSVPERALLLARATGRVALSPAVEAEIRQVFARPKFRGHLIPGRLERVLDLIVAGALVVEPTIAVADCRDAKDNKYLELALAAGAEIIVASDDDLLVLNPWRGIAILTPAAYVRRIEAMVTVPGGEPR